MTRNVRVLGVHPVEAGEAVHLIEMVVEGNADEFDFGEVTQEDPTQPRTNWQVAYEEQLLGESEDGATYACFFHYVDVEKPLLTSFGPVKLPKPTKTPAHLQHIRYEPP